MQNKLPTIIGTAIITFLITIGGMYINNPGLFKGAITDTTPAMMQVSPENIFVFNPQTNEHHNFFNPLWLYNDTDPQECASRLSQAGQGFLEFYVEMQ